MRMNLFKIVLVVTVTFLFLAGCSDNVPVIAAVEMAKKGTAPEKPKTIRIAWWGNQTRNDCTQEVLQMYQDAHPDVILKGEFVDWSGYWDKMAMQSAANSLPDIIQMDYSYIGQYADKGLLANLLPYSVKGDLNIRGIPVDFLSPGIIRDGLYGIPLGINALVIFYDPMAFIEAGIKTPTAQWSWKQYEEILTRVHKNTGKQSDPLLYMDPIYILEYKARQHGESLYSNNGRTLGFTNSDIIQQFFELLDHLTDEKVYISPDKVPVNAPLEESPVAKGQTFMGSGWSNQVVATVNAAGRPLEMVSLPLDGGSKGLYNKPAMFFSVAAASSCIDQSVLFINYFINDISANKTLLAERGVPVVPEIISSLEDSVDASTKATFEYINKINYMDGVVGATAAPAPIAGIQVNKLMKDLYNQVAFGNISPHDAAVRFMEQANNILAEDR